MCFTHHAHLPLPASASPSLRRVCPRRREDPKQIIQDMVAGLPDEVVNKYSGYVYFPFQV